MPNLLYDFGQPSCSTCSRGMLAHCELSTALTIVVSPQRLLCLKPTLLLRKYQHKHLGLEEGTFRGKADLSRSHMGTRGEEAPPGFPMY